jgi:NTP pyrophosphatase (non-canonical NTP hydrolase)
MQFNDYQKFAAKGIRRESEGKNLLVGFALGLGGESGEVLDDIKKREYHGRDISTKHTAEELGDVLWYVANLATQLGYSLEDIVEYNVYKLKNRYPDLYKEE